MPLKCVLKIARLLLNYMQILDPHLFGLKLNLTIAYLMRSDATFFLFLPPFYPCRFFGQLYFPPVFTPGNAAAVMTSICTQSTISVDTCPWPGGGSIGLLVRAFGNRPRYSVSRFIFLCLLLYLHSSGRDWELNRKKKWRRKGDQYHCLALWPF